MAQAKAQLVRFQQGKLKFEILTKPGTVLKYREGKLGWDKVLMADAIFTNSSRGDLASGKDLEDAFGTSNIEECCKKIVEQGELQVSAQERKDEIEAKKHEVIQHIFKNYMDPKTKLPHPPERVEACMKDCHIKIDGKKDAKKQAEDAVKAMSSKLPFTRQVAMTVRLFIKHSYVGQCNNIIHAAGNVLEQDWKSRPDGCIFVLELSKAGDGSTFSSVEEEGGGGGKKGKKAQHKGKAKPETTTSQSQTDTKEDEAAPTQGNTSQKQSKKQKKGKE
ncbi:putative RNA-associated protein [Reticulomyxa filosa]|uniref:Putative RNA-associated protein n=1 Tax=Reticulomyxa filosa TaxID=46433 RepID=X6NJA0_RETFI|nr:putative RNA-associated protein [Reticulomyxa filosa]|eukprot:ETO25407.1 putative RNA-associated protein [Reticulomyxa filosa]